MSEKLNASERRTSPDLTTFTHKAMIFVALVGLGIALYKLSTVFLLVAGAIVVAALVHLVADPITTRLRVPRKAAIACAVLAIFGAVGLCVWFFGREIAAQFDLLSNDLPQSVQGLRDLLGSSAVGQVVMNLWDNGANKAGALLTSVRSTLGSALSAGVSFVVAVVAGIILAISPSYHRDGVLLLFPDTRRSRYRAVMNASGRALQGWLIGQFISMSIIGVLTSLGLMMVGITSWLALGIVAGLAQFVPLIGPILSAIPGLAIAASLGINEFLWTMAVYVVIQQLESNLITPYVMRRATSLPMVLTLFSIVAFGVLLGPLGVILATPITVVLYVMVQMLYVEDHIGETLDVKGEKREFADPE